MAYDDLLEAVENVVAGAVLARVEEGNPEKDEDAAEVMVAAAGEASTGADKPFAEKMLIMLVVVTVTVTISVCVEIGGGGETMSPRPETMRVRHKQTIGQRSIMNSILNGGIVGFWTESYLLLERSAETRTDFAVRMFCVSQQKKKLGW
jgi:hypothetical protein